MNSLGRSLCGTSTSQDKLLDTTIEASITRVLFAQLAIVGDGSWTEHGKRGSGPKTGFGTIGLDSIEDAGVYGTLPNGKAPERSVKGVCV